MNTYLQLNHKQQILKSKHQVIDIKMKDTVRSSYHRIVKRGVAGITASSRVLPDFIIIGTARSGTTSLYYNICEHPSVLPAAYDEIGFFDSNYHLGINWYRSMFPTKRKMEQVKEKTGFAITGEDTPFYIWDPLVAERILKILPNVKLIVLIRNPVDRAYSNYHLGLRSGTENLSFEDAIKSELSKLETVETNSENITAKFTIPRSYIVKGLYAEQLKIWFELFRSDQLLIVNTDDFEAHPQKVLNEIYGFLEIPEINIGNLEKHKVELYEKMKSSTRGFLLDLYKPYNEILFNLIGQKFDWDK